MGNWRGRVTLLSFNCPQQRRVLLSKKVREYDSALNAIGWAVTEGEENWERSLEVLLHRKLIKRWNNTPALGHLAATYCMTGKSREPVL